MAGYNMGMRPDARRAVAGEERVGKDFDARECSQVVTGGMWALHFRGAFREFWHGRELDETWHDSCRARRHTVNLSRKYTSCFISLSASSARADFDQAVRGAGKTLTASAACYALRISQEKLHILIAEGDWEAWAFYTTPETQATHHVVSRLAVVAWGVRHGVFQSAADAGHLVTAEEFATLAAQERAPRLDFREV